MIHPEVKPYLLNTILPRYAAYDKGHNEDHILKVVANAMALSAFYPVDETMLYVAAIYHDLGLCQGRTLHHIHSAELFLEDAFLQPYFDEAQRKTIAEAIEDHRASSKSEPRSIYGKLLAEADRDIHAVNIVRRTVQYGLMHYPELNQEEHYERLYAHLQAKYAEGGYLRLWIPESDNATQLAQLRAMMKQEGALKKLFDELYTYEKSESCV